MGEALLKFDLHQISESSDSENEHEQQITPKNPSEPEKTTSKASRQSKFKRPGANTYQEEGLTDRILEGSHYLDNDSHL